MPYWVLIQQDIQSKDWSIDNATRPVNKISLKLLVQILWIFLYLYKFMLELHNFLINQDRQM
jgi:hypothetical protein